MSIENQKPSTPTNNPSTQKDRQKESLSSPLYPTGLPPSTLTEWFILPNASRLYRTSEKTARKYTKLLIEKGSLHARRRVEGKNKKDEDIFLYEITKEACDHYWNTRPQKEIAEIDKGRKVKRVRVEQATQRVETRVEQPVSSRPQGRKDSLDVKAIRKSFGRQLKKQNKTHQRQIRKIKEKGRTSLRTYQKPPSDKYVKLLEDQNSADRDTIKDIRETNKYLAISNRDLNQKIVELLQAPKTYEKRADT